MQVGEIDLSFGKMSNGWLRSEIFEPYLLSNSFSFIIMSEVLIDINAFCPFFQAMNGVDA